MNDENQIKYNYSIIIPHFNIPNLLERCIRSIPRREDIQIIVVDDCSPQTDQLRFVLDKLKNKGVEVYSTIRGGSAGRARNVGLNHAKGKWLIFADADDYFDSSLSEIMDAYVDATEDVLYFNYRAVLSNNVEEKSSRGSDYTHYFDEYTKYGNTDKFRFYYNTPWGKMISRSFVRENDFRFDETKYANDAMFAALIGCTAKKILPVNKNMYVLTERNDSLTNDFCQKPGETAIRAKVALRVNKLIKDSGFAVEYDYESFLRQLLWNKEYKDLLSIYRDIEKYGLDKCEFLHLVYKTGLRYIPTCCWLLINGIFSH